MALLASALRLRRHPAHGGYVRTQTRFYMRGAKCSVWSCAAKMPRSPRTGPSPATLVGRVRHAARIQLKGCSKGVGVVAAPVRWVGTGVATTNLFCHHVHRWDCPPQRQWRVLLLARRRQCHITRRPRRYKQGPPNTATNSAPAAWHVRGRHVLTARPTQPTAGWWGRLPSTRHGQPPKIRPSVVARVRRGRSRQSAAGGGVPARGQQWQVRWVLRGEGRRWWCV